MRDCKTGRILLTPALLLALSSCASPAYASYKKPQLNIRPYEFVVKKAVPDKQKKAPDPKLLELELDLSKIILNMMEGTGRKAISCMQAGNASCLEGFFTNSLKRVYERGRERNSIETRISSLSFAGLAFNPDQRKAIAIGMAVSLAGGMRTVGKGEGGPRYVRETLGKLSRFAGNEKAFFAEMERWVLSQEGPEVLAQRLARKEIK